MATTTKKPSTNRPASAKKPQDHKQPEAKKTSEGYTGVVRGLEVTVDAEVFEDFETLDDLREVDDDPTLAPRVMRRLFGHDQYRRVLDHLRDKDTGRVSVEDGVGFLSEAFEILFPNS